MGQRVGPQEGREVITRFKERRRETADLLLGCNSHESTESGVHYSASLTIKLTQN